MKCNYVCFLFILSILFSIIAIGCETETGTNINETEVNDNDQNVISTENADSNNIHTKTESDAEITQKILDVWEERGRVYVHYSIEIKNIGDNTIEIEWPVTVSLIGDNNSILYTDNPETFPGILKPGESAYLGDGRRLENVDTTDDVKDIEVDFNYYETQKSSPNLDLEDLNYFIESYRIRITGRVVNSLDTDAESVRIKIALFDEDDNMLGTVFGYTSGKISPGSKLGFDATSSSIDFDSIKDRIDYIDGRAYDLRY